MATKKKAAAPPENKPTGDAPRRKLAELVNPAADVKIAVREEDKGGDIILHRLESVMRSIESIIPNILQLEAAAGRAKIESEETFQKGSTFVSTCDAQWEQLEVLRKSVKKPVDDYGRLIQATFLPYQNRLTVIRDKVHAMMTTFYRADEARKKAAADKLRQEQEERAQAIAQEHEKAGNTEVAQAVLDAALAAPAPSAVVTLGKTRNEAGETVSVRKSWKGAVQDREALLRAILDGKVPWVVIEFKQSEINTVARQVAAEGVIHGIKVTHEADLSFRS